MTVYIAPVPILGVQRKNERNANRRHKEVPTKLFPGIKILQRGGPGIGIVAGCQGSGHHKQQRRNCTIPSHSSRPLIAQLGGGGNVLGADLSSPVRQSRRYSR